MIGFLGGFANLWLGQSFKLSEVSLVSPLKYLALVFGIIFGYLIFGQTTVTKPMILGAALVIIGIGIIIYYDSNEKEEYIVGSKKES